MTFKTALLLALASAKRVGDLCALSVHPSCLSFSQDGGMVCLWPNPAFQPKVITSDFRSRVIQLRVLCALLGDSTEASRLSCPVRALRCYIDRTARFRTTDQLFVVFGTWGWGRPCHPNVSPTGCRVALPRPMRRKVAPSGTFFRTPDARDLRVYGPVQRSCRQ